jgi:hypothetical protein
MLHIITKCQKLVKTQILFRGKRVNMPSFQLELQAPVTGEQSDPDHFIMKI